MSETIVTDTETQSQAAATGWTDSRASSRGLKMHHDEGRTLSNTANISQLEKSTPDRIQSFTLESPARPPRDIHGTKWVFARKFR